MRRMGTWAAVVITLVWAAGCSTTGSQDAAATTRPPTVTTEATTTSTAPSGGDADPRLAKALPSASEIGDGYEVTDADGFPNQEETDPRVADACPEIAAAQLRPVPRDGARAARTYQDEAGTTVGIGIAETPPTFTEETVEELIAAYQACKPFTLDDPRAGEVAYSVQAIHGGYGDYGAVFLSDVSYTYQGQKIELEGQYVIFSLDGISVAISIVNAPQADGTVEPIPEDQLRDLALLMEHNAGAL